MKKLAFILALLAAVLSGCFAEKPENAVWDRNPTEHWTNGKNGEKLNVSEHALNEENFCEICGCEISDQGNGVITVSDYDEKDNPVRVTNFAFSGNSFDDYITEYKYGEDGEILYSETFENGRLCEVFEKTGETVQKDYYYIDGSHHLSISYPGYLGDTIINQWYAYDPEGNIEYEEHTENLLDKNGEIYLNRTTYIHYPSETKVVSEANALGHPLSVEKYDLDGNLIDDYDYAYEYGEENLIVYEKIMRHGNLYKEYFSKVITQGERLATHLYKEIVYHETGHYIIEYENGGIVSETHYDSEGNIISGFPFGKYTTERIFTNHLNSNSGSTPINYTISEKTISAEFYGESKTIENSDSEWEELPFSEEEWAGFFDNPEQIIDLEPYGKIMYKPINDFHFILSANGDFALVSLTYLNMGSYNQLVIWRIDKLIPQE